MAQNFKNLAYSLVATAPVPAASGTSLVVTAGEGALLPSVPFQGTIWPTASIPTAANAEIVTVTNVSTDTLTITRAQEGTSARTVIVGDQFAATVTALMISTLESGISAVSAAVTSVDTHAGAASAAATSADGHAATASAAATSADGHAATASAAATSADAHAAAASAAATSVLALHNVLSNVVSASLVLGDVASNALSALSDRVVSVSAQITSLEVHASAASAAATSADAHANAASAAATSVNSRVTSVNAAISAISARSVGDVSTHGFQSVINALSGRISAIVAGAASVTSAEVQTLSTAVTSVDTHAATASAAATSADGHAATASLAATSADAHAAAASLAATSVLAGISAVSSRSVGGVSTHGLQSVVDALSNRISAIPGAASTPPIRIMSATATVPASALVAISGLSVQVSAGVTYKIQGIALFNRATANITGFGLEFPATVNGNTAGGRLHAVHSAVQSVGAGGLNITPWRGDASGSILISLSTGGTASGALMVDGVMRMSAGGTVAIMGRAASTGALLIMPGSYLELKRIS